MIKLPVVPSILHTNRESRKIALEHYTLIDRDTHTLARGPPDYEKMNGPWPRPPQTNPPGPLGGFTNALANSLPFQGPTAFPLGGAGALTLPQPPRRRGRCRGRRNDNDDLLFVGPRSPSESKPKPKLFYTNFGIDSYILEMEDFPSAFPAFRLQGDFYLSQGAPNTLPNIQSILGIGMQFHKSFLFSYSDNS
jgi:hypothetical protein